MWLQDVRYYLDDAGRAYNEETAREIYGWEKSRAQSEGESSNHEEMRFVPLRHDKTTLVLSSLMANRGVNTPR